MADVVGRWFHCGTGGGEWEALNKVRHWPVDQPDRYRTGHVRPPRRACCPRCRPGIRWGSSPLHSKTIRSSPRTSVWLGSPSSATTRMVLRSAATSCGRWSSCSRRWGGVWSPSVAMAPPGARPCRPAQPRPVAAPIPCSFPSPGTRRWPARSPPPFATASRCWRGTRRPFPIAAAQGVVAGSAHWPALVAGGWGCDPAVGPRQRQRGARAGGAG